MCLEICSGEDLEPFNEILHKLSQSSSCEQFGFRLDFNPNKMSSEVCIEADIRDEEEWAGRLFHFSLALARHRIMSLTHYTYALPGVFILALPEKESDVQWLLKWMKAQWQSWCAFNDSGIADNKSWILVKERSVFQHQMSKRFFRAGFG